MKDLLFFTKYPSTAGILIILWAGSTLLVWQSGNALVPSFVYTVNTIVSVIIGVVGFRVDRK